MLPQKNVNLLNLHALSTAKNVSSFRNAVSPAFWKSYEIFPTDPLSKEKSRSITAPVKFREEIM